MSITKEKTKHIDELHFENQLWIQEVKFYKEELFVFNKRLIEANKYSDKKILARIEHYQNQFILQNEVADTLLHDLNLHEQYLIDTAKQFPVAIDRRAFKDHPEMRERITIFLKIYRELRNDYMKFLAEVM